MKKSQSRTDLAVALKDAQAKIKYYTARYAALYKTVEDVLRESGVAELQTQQPVTVQIKSLLTSTSPKQKLLRYEIN